MERSSPSAVRVSPSRLPSYTQQFQSFLDGGSSPREYLETCIATIGALEGRIAAFAHLDLDRARGLADEAAMRFRLGRPLSPIDGMPIGVKDIIETQDAPTQMNSPIFEGYQPRRDAACVIALTRAGAITIGKTVTTEFACGRSGPTANPHDPSERPAVHPADRRPQRVPG